MSAEQQARQTVVWSLSFWIILTLLFYLAISKKLDEIRQEKRNACLLRDWGHHAYPAPQKPQEKLIIIISNSQGYGTEVEDEQTYPFILEQLLNQSGKETYKVLNWSVPGGQIPEQLILTAAAARLHPEKLLFINSPASFSQRHLAMLKQPFSNSILGSDVYLLLAYSDVREVLPELYSHFFYQSKVYLNATLARIFPLWSIRTYPLSLVNRVSFLQPFDKSGEINPWHFPHNISIEQTREKFLKTVNNTHSEYPAVPYENFSTELLNHFFSITKMIDGEKYFIFMPHHTIIRNKNSLIIPKISQTIQENDIQVVDMRAAVPDSYYLSSVHFDQTGHRIMAEKLAEAIIR